MQSIAFQSRHLLQIIFQQTSKIESKVNMTLKEYLLSLGQDIFENPTRLEAAKKEYQRVYMREYKKQYNKENKRVKITFKKDEYEAIEKEANKMKKPVATHIKDLLMAYIHSEYILPNDVDVKEMNRLILAIGNNVNQIARWGNENRFIAADSIKYLYQQLKMIKDKMDDTFKRPDNVLDLVKQSIEDNPFLKKELLNLLLNDKEIDE